MVRNLGCGRVDQLSVVFGLKNGTEVGMGDMAFFNSFSRGPRATIIVGLRSSAGS